MKLFFKVPIVMALLDIISVSACEKAIDQMACQVEQEKFENLKQLQLDTITAFAHSKNPQLQTLKKVLFILSYGSTFPEISSHIEALQNAYEQFLNIPGFSHKFLHYLCNLGKQKSRKDWREIALAVDLYHDQSERIDKFHASFKQGSVKKLFFSLLTDKRWIYWRHDNLYPRATRETNRNVIGIKQRLILLRDLVERFNKKGNGNSVEFNLYLACPPDKTWRQWFSEQKITYKVWTSAEFTVFRKYSHKLRHQI